MQQTLENAVPQRNYHAMAFSHKSMTLQPWLSPEFESGDHVISDDALRRSGKAVVDELLRYRRSFKDSEKAVWVPEINTTIERIRAFCRLSDTQREEVILFAIERSGCTTLTEISEDTRLDKTVVFEILKSLHQKQIIYQVKKHVPGSDRPWLMYKSKRMRSPEGV